MARTFAAIAREIKSEWAKPYFGAVPYINAMLSLDTTDPQAHYLFDTADDIVTRFLCNAGTWRGPKARAIKAELKSML